MAPSRSLRDSDWPPRLQAASSATVASTATPSIDPAPRAARPRIEAHPPPVPGLSRPIRSARAFRSLGSARLRAILPQRSQGFPSGPGRPPSPGHRAGAVGLAPPGLGQEDGPGPGPDSWDGVRLKRYRRRERERQSAGESVRERLSVCVCDQEGEAEGEGRECERRVIHRDKDCSRERFNPDNAQ